MSNHPTQPVEVPIDRIRQPLQRVIHMENLSGLALIAGAVIALVLANTAFAEPVDDFWHYYLDVALGPIHLHESLLHWVNDGLMTIFFFVAGLEIKRELVVGDLREPRKAALPAVAAAGGMIIPALVFLAIAGPETRNGWGIPMATDIAFAVGILTLLGDRVPSRLKVFLLTLAIVDDLGAIVVIALFYTTSLNTTALAVAGALLLGMVAMRVLGVWWMPAYVIAGSALWLAVFESGIHATLAGVVCGLMAPAKPRRPKPTEIVAGEHNTIDELKAVIFDTRETTSVVDRLIHGLHPFTALLIVPIFALANTGVGISGESLGNAMTSSTGLAVLLGLLVGKPVGITFATWLAVRTNLAVLPPGVNWGHVVGVGFLGGIGFTVSLFITDLAYAGNAAIIDNSKIAVLMASVLASAFGAIVLLKSSGTPSKPASDEESQQVGTPQGESQSNAEPISFEELNATSADSFIASGTPVPPQLAGPVSNARDNGASAEH
ncbi:MAG: Na+/H+ antiporter NhaA [Acidimicrobiales bacterium]